MSMNAEFVQVDVPELTRLQSDTSMAEALFQDGPMIPPVFARLDEKMRERVKNMGPQLLANQLSQLDPRIRQKLEERLGQSTSELAGGKGGDAILKLMQERGARDAAKSRLSGSREKLSLEKDWHGVHFVLCGEAELGAELLSQAVLALNLYCFMDLYLQIHRHSHPRANNFARSLSRRKKKVTRAETRKTEKQTSHLSHRLSAAEAKTGHCARSKPGARPAWRPA
jgi:hypothetical protein